MSPKTTQEPDLGDFFQNEMRGYRLLKAASISYQARQQVMTLTGNSVDFEKVRQALRALFEDGPEQVAKPKRRLWWTSTEEPIAEEAYLQEYPESEAWTWESDPWWEAAYWGSSWEESSWEEDEWHQEEEEEEPDAEEQAL